jgi:peptide/nickel transport system ATP-binding protein
VALLEVKGLSVHYATRGRIVRAVDDVSFSLPEGRVLGVVGESGCGKTTTALALMGLLPDTARISGQIVFDGRDLVPLSQEELRRVRWREISMIFQGAMNALTPVYTVGEQIVEAIVAHEPQVSERDARARVAELYEAVGLSPDRRDDYPHQYSGGMKQRAVIAMSLACDPKLVIADEPTTALDVMVQDRILRELRRIQRERQQSMLYISHDMAVVAGVADTVAVMYAGKLVEIGPTASIYSRPVHPYTGALMASTPSLTGPRRRLVSLPGAPPNLGDAPSGCPFHPRCPNAGQRCVEQHPPLELHRDGLVAACWFPLPAEGGIGRIEAAFGVAAPESVAPAVTPLVSVDQVNKIFAVGKTLLRKPRRHVHAVKDVTLSIARGEAFGLVGQSGSGKTTLGRLIVGLETPTAGRLQFQFNGTPMDVGAIDRRELRRQVQMIFQDPYESLNPRMTIGRIVAEPLDVLAIGDRATRHAKVERILERVGLPAQVFADRYPHELSGGQRQRVAVARAMVVEPSFVVADEPTSMLDVSVRAGIIDLLLGFKREGVSYLYVTHDLAVARYICDRIAVMHEGRIVEMGATEDVLQNPKDSYTRDLIAAVPKVNP